jgi:hypothetical protein
MTAANDLAVRQAVELAGIEFIDENGGGAGGTPSKARKRKISKMIACGRMSTAVDIYTALPYR